MCGIAGFYQNQFDYLKERTRYRSILEQMYFVQKHRGPMNPVPFWPPTSVWPMCACPSSTPAAATSPCFGL